MSVGARALALAAIVLASTAAGSARAEDKYQPPADIAAKLRAIGNNMSGEPYRLYGAMLANMPKDGVKRGADLAYGRDPLQKLDVYEPIARPARPMPVFIFIHGGGFIMGDKLQNGGPFYANLGYWFARHNVVTVIADYRLAPKDPWPAGARDMAGIVAWTHAHIADRGGDPRHIILMGKSAGASHVAAYVLERRFQPRSGPGVAGVILLSGFYDPALETKAAPRFGMSGPGKRNEAYYGKEIDRYPMRATLKHVTRAEMPVLIAYNELDPPMAQIEAGMMFGALCEHGKQCPRLLWIPGHVHGSAILTVNTPDEWMAQKLLDFIRAPGG